MKTLLNKYQAIVIGAGHAGCEAAHALAKLGKITLLITGHKEQIATLPCNPSIGGPAKGVLVREIDALGGLMAKIADQSILQIKMLNSSKGPAVWALRAQIDKINYPRLMHEELLNTANLTLEYQYAKDIIVKDGEVSAVVLEDGKTIETDVLVITTGTYLRSKILIGQENISMGPDGSKTTYGVSDALKREGFEIIRLKTGTPPRIKASSIDYYTMQRQPGDGMFYKFSYYHKLDKYLDNRDCFLLHTSLDTKQVILDDLKYSPIYSGVIKGTGPRYCPSIEDKIVRFREKDIHQIFVEPETNEEDLIYLQGVSTSLPRFTQRKIIKTLRGFKEAKIKRYGYAIEYDAINPIQLYPSLETKLVKNLFTAGQINGTSGYEEAACQGLMAGINASLRLDNKEPFILKRDEAYIGVLIDDLVTKGTKEPYRMLTSRAEYRLLLRDDNADLRLSEYGHNLGLLSNEFYQIFIDKKENIYTLIEKLKEIKITPTKEILEFLESINTVKIYESIKLYDLLKRPEVSLSMLKQFLDKEYKEEVLQEVDILVKYQGYIEKELKEVERYKRLEYKKIPQNLDYDLIQNLSEEAKEKLKRIRPLTIGQASRILGVNPTDISILTIYLERRPKNG